MTESLRDAEREPRNPRRELEFLRTRMEAQARGRWASDLEDLSMEAWVVLDRVLRKEAARNLEALMMRIARFVWIDWTRRHRGPAPINIDDPEEGFEPVAPQEDPGIDPETLGLLRFCVLEFFEAHGATECLELAGHFFAGRTWFQVAALISKKRDAVAKRWERCRRRVVEAFRADLPGPLRDAGLKLDEVLA